jgi:hypothetical protein
VVLIFPSNRGTKKIGPVPPPNGVVTGDAPFLAGDGLKQQQSDAPDNHFLLLWNLSKGGCHIISLSMKVFVYGIAIKCGIPIHSSKLAAGLSLFVSCSCLFWRRRHSNTAGPLRVSSSCKSGRYKDVSSHTWSITW